MVREEREGEEIHEIKDGFTLLFPDYYFLPQVSRHVLVLCSGMAVWGTHPPDQHRHVVAILGNTSVSLHSVLLITSAEAMFEQQSRGCVHE